MRDCGRGHARGHTSTGPCVCGKRCVLASGGEILLSSRSAHAMRRRSTSGGGRREARVRFGRRSAASGAGFSVWVSFGLPFSPQLVYTVQVTEPFTLLEVCMSRVQFAVTALFSLAMAAICFSFLGLAVFFDAAFIFAIGFVFFTTAGVVCVYNAIREPKPQTMLARLARRHGLPRR